MANRKDIVNRVFDKLEGAYTKKTLKEIVDSYEDSIIDALAEGEEVNLTNFAKFSIVDVPERKGVSAFNGGKEWVKPAHQAIKMKPIGAIKNLYAE